jgi:hypothetical protein
MTKRARALRAGGWTSLWLAAGLATAVAGAGNTEGPPPGYTGGFGEPTCRNCHADLPLNAPGGSLAVGGLDGELAAGEARRVTLTLNGEGMERAGFQAAFRLAEGEPGAPAGRLRALDERTRVVRESSSGVEYVQQTETGSELVNGEGRWEFEWAAPESAATVALHVSANSANGDDSPLGDLVYTQGLRVRVR